MNETWIILGATSSMAKAFARAVSELGHGVLLAGRDMDDLKRSAADWPPIVRLTGRGFARR